MKRAWKGFSIPVPFTLCPLDFEDNGVVCPDNARKSSRWSQTTRLLYSLSVSGYDALLNRSKFRCFTSTEGKFLCVTNTEGLSVRFHIRRVRSSARQPISNKYTVSFDVRPAQAHHPWEIIYHGHYGSYRRWSKTTINERFQRAIYHGMGETYSFFLSLHS